MYIVVFNFWRKISYFLLIVTLLYCYIQLPDNIAFEHNEMGRPIGFLAKQKFFYLAAAILVSFNVLMSIFRSKIIQLDYQQIFPSSAWAKNKENTSEIISNWFNAFVAFINTYLVFVLLGLLTINKMVNKNLETDNSWFLVMGAIIVMLFLFFLPIKFLYSKPSN